MNVEDIFSIIGAVLLPNIGGWVGSIALRYDIYGPFTGIKKMSPILVFVFIWTILHSAIGYASYLVFDSLRSNGNGFDKTATIALTLYLTQLVLNWAWVLIFFRYDSFSWGTLDLVTALILASGCAYVFGEINLVAGLIFIPYIFWMMCFAGYLCVFPLFIDLIMHLCGSKFNEN